MQPRCKIIAFVAGLFATSAALACGVNFPWQLLQDRADTFRSLPLDSFGLEATRLVSKPQEAFAVVEADQASSPPPHTPADLAASEHPDDRASGNSRSAAGRPPLKAVSFYAAGSALFASGNLPSAVAQFQLVLALPEPGPYSVRAAYMLGRCYVTLGATDNAIAAYALTRSLVRKGASDPLGLALASYGSEARLHLRNAEALNGASLAAPTAAEAENTPSGSGEHLAISRSLTPPMATAFQQNVGQAVLLYALQAADGSTNGVNSLAYVALRLILDRTALNASIKDPTVARLLVSFVLARDDDLTTYAGRPDSTDSMRSPLAAVVNAFSGSKMGGFPGADRLAAAAYRIGYYEAAGKLVEKSETPLGYWIKAKLAVRNGDLTTAASDYARSSAAFPTVSIADRLDPETQARILGETGTLALSRGELVQSLAILYPVAVTYWADVVHIAERVLTTDELKNFVDGQAPGISTKLGSDLTANIYWGPTTPLDGLRYVLAKRLVRDGRLAEAIPYFDDVNIRQHVADYARALDKASSAWWPVSRAHALFDAAVFARQFGMEMMGYTAQPDESYTGGDNLGFGEATAFGPFTAKLELIRFASSTPQPNFRFHYRYIAVDHASHAADLLPPRSQAFAAVLCRASSWMLYRDAPLAQRLYGRYLREGPAVPWAAQFAQRCPTPDFHGANHLIFTLPATLAHRFASHHRRGMLAAFGVAILLAALGTVVHRRAKGSAV